MADAATTASGSEGAASSLPRSLNYVAGCFVPAASGRFLGVENPATGSVIAEIPLSAEEDVNAAADAAEEAFRAWRFTSFVERAAFLDRIADGIAARAEELARVESEDSGKTLTMARTVDIPRAEANLRFFAGAIRHDETGTYVMKDAINYTLRQPLGIAGLITPWNLPLYLLTWKVAPALAMGNCVVAKPSELTPRTATILAEIIHAAGVPAGVFNIVHGTGPMAGQALVAHPKIRLISFTGGTATGKHVAATAAPMFKRLSLELGGKNSTIVFDDCDLDATVAGAVRSAFTNNGQVCLAGSRLLVHRPIYDAFVPRFVESVRALRVGDPSSTDTHVGPVSSAMHRAKIETYVRYAREEGGVVECGGGPPADLPESLRGGFFISPTVVTGLPATSRVSTEEIFGPVVTVHAFDTEDEAIEMANMTCYGLAGSVWTSNLRRAHRVAARVESGIVWVNCWLHRDLRTAFGGMKDSGIGREGGKYSLEFYSEFKNVCIFVGADGPGATGASAGGGSGLQVASGGGK